MKKSLRKHPLALTLVVLFLLIGLPVILIAGTQSSDSRTHATAATTLAFMPSSSTTSPLPATLSTPFSLDMYLNPVTNLVSFVKVEIDYDPTYFTADATPITLNPTSGLMLQEGPYVSPGKITFSAVTGSNTSSALSAATTIGTVHLLPIAKTPKRGTTSVTFGSTTTILSINSTDSSQENVLSSTTPAVVVISGSTTTSGGHVKK